MNKNGVLIAIVFSFIVYHSLLPLRYYPRRYNIILSTVIFHCLWVGRFLYQNESHPTYDATYKSVNVFHLVCPVYLDSIHSGSIGLEAVMTKTIVNRSFISRRWSLLLDVYEVLTLCHFIVLW